MPNETGQRMVMTFIRTCQDCGRVFSLLEEVDCEEWHYGHDCDGW